jgi:Lar family restriction alleviation protein
MEIAASPCPFCESKDVKFVLSVHNWIAVKCEKCGATGPDAHESKGYSTNARVRALAAWNRQSARLG